MYCVILHLSIRRGKFYQNQVNYCLIIGSVLIDTDLCRPHKSYSFCSQHNFPMSVEVTQIHTPGLFCFMNVLWWYNVLDWPVKWRDNHCYVEIIMQLTLYFRYWCFYIAYRLLTHVLACRVCIKLVTIVEGLYSKLLFLLSQYIVISFLNNFFWIHSNDCYCNVYSDWQLDFTFI